MDTLDIIFFNFFLSFSTMIVPSSDWFTGFTTNLMSGGKWINKITIPLYIAGTDSNQDIIQKLHLTLSVSTIVHCSIQIK
jgi:hypothetical protein